MVSLNGRQPFPNGYRNVDMNRRTFLRTGAIASAVTLAGCAGVTGGPRTVTVIKTPVSTTTATPSPTPTSTPVPASFEIDPPESGLERNLGANWEAKFTVVNRGGQSGMFDSTLQMQVGDGEWQNVTDVELEVPGGSRANFRYPVPNPGSVGPVRFRLVGYETVWTIQAMTTPTPTPTPTPIPTPTATPVPYPGLYASDVSLKATDARPSDAFTSLGVEFNWRAQMAIDLAEGDGKAFYPVSGRKWLIVKFRVSNTGDSDIELSPSFFDVDASGAVYDYQPLEGVPNGLSGVTLHPGGDVTAWSAYAIPEDTTKATLVADQEVYYGTVQVDFSHDGGLVIDIPLGDAREYLAGSN